MGIINNINEHQPCWEGETIDKQKKKIFGIIGDIKGKNIKHFASINIPVGDQINADMTNDVRIKEYEDRTICRFDLNGNLNSNNVENIPWQNEEIVKELNTVFDKDLKSEDYFPLKKANIQQNPTVINLIFNTISVEQYDYTKFINCYILVYHPVYTQSVLNILGFSSFLVYYARGGDKGFHLLKDISNIPANLGFMLLKIEGKLIGRNYVGVIQCNSRSQADKLGIQWMGIVYKKF